VGRVLSRAKLRHVLDDVKPLPLPPTIGRALTPDEKAKLLATSVLKPEWETCFFALQLALATTLRGADVRRSLLGPRKMDHSFN
jgi:hypothetical protein